MSAGSHVASIDVAVVGGGPAGAAAALEAARAGLSVALFEPQERQDKPCGEGILPAGVAALRELGLGRVADAGEPLRRIRYVLAGGRALEVPLEEPGAAIERHALADALADALAREPRVTRIARRAVAERDGKGDGEGFALASGGERWSARALIAADGLQGDCARWLRRPRTGARRHGLRARAAARRGLESVEVHLGRRSEVYLTPLSLGRINVAVLRDEPEPGARSGADSLAAALREHPLAAEALGEWLTPPESRALSRARPRRVAQGRAFLAGDAAGGVDPVLGCGVALALVTGRAAARAAARALADGSGAAERDYRALVRRETYLRAALARSLVLLAAHPRLQSGVARVLGAWPGGVARLARRVAGG